MLTQKEVRRALHYHPETGIFTWLNRPGCAFDRRGSWANWSKRFSGKIAGCINSVGYRVIRIGDTLHLAHRLAILYMEGSFPPIATDHINRDKLDNRFANLRRATTLDNNRNLGISKANTSGTVGVGWCKQTSKWAACISVNNKNIRLGRYSHKKDAVEARKAAQVKYGFHENHGLPA